MQPPGSMLPAVMGTPACVLMRRLWPWCLRWLLLLVLSAGVLPTTHDDHRSSSAAGAGVQAAATAPHPDPVLPQLAASAHLWRSSSQMGITNCKLVVRAQPRRGVGLLTLRSWALGPSYNSPCVPWVLLLEVSTNPPNRAHDGLPVAVGRP